MGIEERWRAAEIAFADAVAASKKPRGSYPSPLTPISENAVTWLGPSIAVSQDQALIYYKGNVYRICY